MAPSTQVLNNFRSELGTVEGPRNNETKYAEEAGHAPYQPWCATFVVAMFRRAGMTLPSESAWTPSMLNGLKQKGRVVKDPQPGALAFLYFRNLGRVAHVGIVESVRPDGRFVTIEGNTDVRGGRTGGRVMRKVRSRAGWTFAMPEYDNEEKAPRRSPRTEGAPSVVHAIQEAVEVDSDGMWGPNTDARVMRMRLAARVKCGYPNNLSVSGMFDIKDVQSVIDTKVDGIWGNKSQAALVRWVKDFQKIIDVESDGLWGPKSDGRLIGLRRRHHNKF